MMTKSKYNKQVNLLIEVMELVLDDANLALKGGTAINLFTMDMPRLSVDIDLTYLPITNRDEFLNSIEEVFNNMALRLSNFSPNILRTSDGVAKQIRLSNNQAEVKVELNLILRGTVYPPEIKTLCSKAVRLYEKSAMIKCVSFEDQYAGKFCAALDRQHPRDLFDVKLFFEHFSFTQKLKSAFLVYLISGNRPIHEMIKPNLLDQRNLYKEQFEGMAEKAITYEELEIARLLLIKIIDENLTEQDKMFLVSFKKGTPDWSLLDVPVAQKLPGVRWKLLNISRMNKEKHEKMLKRLQAKLYT